MKEEKGRKHMSFGFTRVRVFLFFKEVIALLWFSNVIKKQEL